MPLVLLKREDGAAALLGTIHHGPGFFHTDLERRLGPNDVIAGRKVSDWPAGVHALPEELIGHYFPGTLE